MAGGLGTRLKPVVSKVPKPMAKVGGKPFLEWQIDQLKKFGIRDIVISIGYMGEHIKRYFGNGKKFEVMVTYVEEEEPLGTGGALKNTSRFLAGEKKFLLMNGDTYLDLNFADFLKFHDEKDALVTMALARREKSFKSGCVRVDKDGRITEFVEKEEGSGLINAGHLLFETQALKLLPQREKFSLECDFYPELVGRGVLFGYLTSCYFRDLGNPEDYEAMKRELGATR